MDQRLYRLLGEVFRTGIVSTIDEAAASARVTFEDRDDVVSYDLQVMVRNTRNNKDYWMPEVGEPVLCLFLPGGIEQGFILGSYYTQVTTPDANTANKRRTYFSDGASIEYDRETHTYTVDIPASGGNVIINAQTSVTVNSPKIDLGESAALEPSVLGDKLAALWAQVESWCNSHTHGNGAGGNPTTEPMAPLDASNGKTGGNVYSQKNRNQ